MNKTITNTQRTKAAICAKNCPICKNARKRQKGFPFWFVKHVEGGMCPACKAYAEVYGRKPHEPIV